MSSNNGVSKVENVNGDVFSARFGAFSIRPTVSDSSVPFRLWHYDCSDFPVHKHYCDEYYFTYGHPCLFCIEKNKLRMFHPNAVNESNERWDSYLERGPNFEDAEALIEYLNTDTEAVLPSKLAKTIYFNKKLGKAIMCGDVPPKAESPENRESGAFQLLLMATTGARSHQLVHDFDKLIVHTVRRMTKLPEDIMKMVNGVFWRCEINPGKDLPHDVPDLFRDKSDLPFFAKLEIWIGNVDAEQQKRIELELIEPIKMDLELLAIPKNAFRQFRFMYHLKHWEEQ